MIKSTITLVTNQPQESSAAIQINKRPPQVPIEIHCNLRRSRSVWDGLPTFRNANGLLLGQTGFTNAPLHFGNIVSSTAWFPDVFFGVINSISRPRITIAWLS